MNKKWKEEEKLKEVVWRLEEGEIFYFFKQKLREFRELEVRSVCRKKEWRENNYW